MLRNGLTVAISVFLLFLALSSAFGQATDGNLTGTVLDPSAAAISNATVTAQNVATGVKTTAKSDASGVYRLDHLLVGTYSVTATAPGFTTTTVGQ